MRAHLKLTLPWELRVAGLATARRPWATKFHLWYRMRDESK